MTQMTFALVGCALLTLSVGAGAQPLGPSVRNYGAVGDGVTDDTAAFQAALDEAGAGAAGSSTRRGGITSLRRTWLFRTT